MCAARRAQRLTIGLWFAVAASLLAWSAVGYAWALCAVGVIVLLAPLHGLARGRRRTYAWATMFTVPYITFALTELLVNPAARWVAGISLLLVFAWFCSMVLFLRVSPAHRE